MNVPMALTAGRLVLAPVFFACYRLAERSAAAGRADRTIWFVSSAWLVFLVIEISDLLDGYLARKLSQVTEAGKVLDPLADAVGRITYFICFAGSRIMPLWVLLLLVYRDVGVSYVRVLFAHRGTLLPARSSGKLKAWIYASAGVVGLGVFSLRALDILPGFRQAIGIVSFWIFLAAAAIAVWSMVDYGLALAGRDKN